MTSATITRPVRSADSREHDAAGAGIPFSRLLRVEWGKATDTRAGPLAAGAGRGIDNRADAGAVAVALEYRPVLR